MAKQKSAAVLTIKHADQMTPTGRKEVAAWLRAQAIMLVREGKNYSARFTGRYLHED